MMYNYLKILEDSLVKKIDIVDKLQTLSEEQTRILGTEPMSLEAFDKCVDEKDILITELNKLDSGFDALYANIKDGLLNNKDAYAEQIQRLQELIQEVMDKSASLQARENRNRDMVTTYFRNEKKQFSEGRRSSKAAYDYYKNMSKSNVVPSHFMDQKK